MVMKKKKKMGFFNVGFFKKNHWVQSDRTQSGPPCFMGECTQSQIVTF